MKTILIIITILTSLYIYKVYNKNIEESYNSNGNKVVKVKCDSKYDCEYAIGKRCKDLGFKIIKNEYSEITAECGKEFSISNLFN